MTSYPGHRYLLDIHSGQLADAEVDDEIRDADIADWRANWQPYVNEVVKRLEMSGTPRHEWPQSHHWDWADKAARKFSLLQRGYAVRCNGALQGLMRVQTAIAGCQIASQRGKDCVYVDYIETAPWNQQQYSSSPRYSLVGTVLIAAALHRSLEQGMKGRIGLHSLPQADTWYSGLGMVDLGFDNNRYNGRLKYFETTPQIATNILNGVLFP